MSLEWRRPGYSAGNGDSEVWNLFDTGLRDDYWELRGVITYLGLTRHQNWGDRLQRWRIDRSLVVHSQVIEVKTVEEAKATALALLTLS